MRLRPTPQTLRANQAASVPLAGNVLGAGGLGRQPPGGGCRAPGHLGRPRELPRVTWRGRWCLGLRCREAPSSMGLWQTRGHLCRALQRGRSRAGAGTGQGCFAKGLLFSRISGRCQEMKVVLEKTDEPGKYTADGGKHVAYIIRSHVKDHYIFYCEGELHGKPIRGVKLVGRDPENNLEALEDFEKAAGARGLSTESVLIPRQSGRRHGPAEPPMTPSGDVSRAVLHEHVTVLHLILALSFLGWWSWWLMRGPCLDCIPGVS
ncbi:lipocalin-1 isoform X2 [Symphalangus syndactylus]|uniref:lipocalin-1 isoform X2 n=1 Tax=Symphalangus syndactylus TaxID=9590 RepID=UPI002441438C|nr:lipocalin-1 isoform X2 [Symphalangus syndactylus]